MRMIRPKLVAPQITIAEDQEEYKPVTAAVVCHPRYESPGKMRVEGVQAMVPMNGLVLAFRPDADERARLVAGEDIYINLLTFGHPMQPIIVKVGPQEMAGRFGVEVEA